MGIVRWFLKRDLRIQVALVLLPFALAAPFEFPQHRLSVLVHLVSALAFAVGFDVLFTAIVKKRWFFPRAALVTGILIGLVLSENASLLATALAAYFATFSKHFVRLKGKHLFNPAVFGLVAVELLYLAFGGSLLVTWWGVSSVSPWMILVLLLGMGTVLMRLRILLLPLGFLLFYGGALAFLSSGVRQFLALLMDPALFLFAWVMLPEYKTSPIIGIWRYIFGLFIAAIWLVLIDVVGIIRPDPLLVSLLVGDLMSLAVRRIGLSFAGAKAAKVA